MLCYIISMFVHMAADNNDFGEETLDGKNTRAISMDHSQKREHLVIILKKEDLWIHQGPWWRCKRLELEERGGLTTYQNKMKDAKWLQENYHFLCNVSEDIMWLLLRLNSDSLFDVNHHPVAHQKITGCSEYQSIKLTKTSFPTAS